MSEVYKLEIYGIFKKEEKEKLIRKEK